MKFNVDKCKVIHVGSNIKRYKYDMNGTNLDTIEMEKDLGVYVTADLKVSSQCLQAYKKGRQLLGMVGRTIKSKLPSILINIYKSTVRPHLRVLLSSLVSSLQER